MIRRRIVDKTAGYAKIAPSGTPVKPSKPSKMQLRQELEIKICSSCTLKHCTGSDKCVRQQIKLRGK